jgi:hypothetical protein
MARRNTTVDSVIKGIEQFFLKCPLLKDGCMRVDFLGPDPVEYVIETLPGSPVVKRYVDGSTVRQYLFAFGSREFYSQDRLQNIENSKFYEDFASWIEKSDKEGNLPTLPQGMAAEHIAVISTGYLFDGSMSHARYQIQLVLQYFKEA